MIINDVGHTQELLDRLHHFGWLCAEQLAIQNQDLQGESRTIRARLVREVTHPTSAEC